MVPSTFQSQLMKIDNSHEMALAIERNLFFIEVFRLHNNGYSAGSIDDCVPALIATKEQALEELEEQKTRIQAEIAANERDADDEWEGEVVPCRFNEDGYIELLFENDMTPFYKSCPKSLCGY